MRYIEMKIDGRDIQMYITDECQLDEYGERNDDVMVHEYEIYYDENEYGGGNISRAFRDLNLDGTHRVTSDFIKEILKKKKNKKINFAPGQESYIPEHTRLLYLYGGDSLENVMMEHMKKIFMSEQNPRVIDFELLMFILFETNKLIKCDGKLYPVNYTDKSEFMYTSIPFRGGLPPQIKIINRQWYFIKFLRENVALRIWANYTKCDRDGVSCIPIEPFVSELRHYYYETQTKRNCNPPVAARCLESRPRLLLDKQVLRGICGYPWDDRFDHKQYNQLFKNKIAQNNLNEFMFLDGCDKPIIHEF